MQIKMIKKPEMGILPLIILISLFFPRPCFAQVTPEDIDKIDRETREVTREEIEEKQRRPTEELPKPKEEEETPPPGMDEDMM